ncbi:MAG TPA: thioredoxin domain-containing protein [Candidatus Saccharimonadales bacterium]|nr:thioredoxin domain-containing protein [Candidatus Saccharimonadales bacterium]
MSKRFWAIIVIILLVFGGILLFGGRNNGSNGAAPTNHIEGQGDAHVTLLEYGDYECPYCEQYYAIVKQVIAQYNTQIYFQFRNLPLTQIHPNAFASARAAEAAGLQNQFWQMHDLLYENQHQWVSSSNPQSYFDLYARQLGLNVTTFNNDFSSTKVNNVINADIDAFSKTGQPEATPTFFLDGQHVTPEPTVDSFARLINTTIAQKSKK